MSLIKDRYFSYENKERKTVWYPNPEEELTYQNLDGELQQIEKNELDILYKIIKDYNESNP